MSKQKQEPKENQNAALGSWLAHKYIWPFKKFDENFPETSKNAQAAFSKVAKEGAKAANKGHDLGAKTVGATGTFLQNRGADIIAYGATAVVLTVRGFFNAIDYLAEKMAKPAIKAYHAWEPKTPLTQSLKKGLNVTGNTIAKGYKGYVSFFTGFDYPKSLPALGGLVAAQAAVSLTGMHYLHEALHLITTGQAGALQYAAVPTLIAGGKGSNLLTIKPAIKLAKTSKEGFFKSDLYKDKLQPVYMKQVDPWVKLTIQHMQEWDNMIENRVEAYRKFKTNMKNQGQMKARVKIMADKAQDGISVGVRSLSATFKTVSNGIRGAAPAAAQLTKAKPESSDNQPPQASKLDGVSITDKWNDTPKSGKPTADASEPDISPDGPTPSGQV